MTKSFVRYALLGAGAVVSVAGLGIGATPLFAQQDSFSAPQPYERVASPPPPLSLYDRIVAHYGPIGHDVREEFRDGPCRVERRWETDGDYEERIKCRGPRH